VAALAEDSTLGKLQPICVEALGWSRDFSLMPMLETFGTHKDPELRIAALKAARQLGHPGVRSWALALLFDPIDVVRVQAVRTCGQLGFVESIPILTTLVENSSWWVRTRAAEALALLRPAQPAPFRKTGLRR
jgi:HEAT repeat protein